MRILTVFGTRPELIKLAPVIHQLQRRRQVDLQVLSTGQHNQMLEQILPFFEIKTDVRLSIMAPGQSLACLLAAAVRNLDGTIRSLPPPDYVIGQGDTTTALAAALVSFFHKIPFVHVEAGLRSYDLENPFPEEMNRVQISHLAAWHMAPTRRARANLIREGISCRRIRITGNTVVDALRWARRKLELPAFANGIRQRLLHEGLEIGKLGQFVLVTAHRRENFGKGLEQICDSLKEIVRLHPKLHIVWPVHLNPSVQETVRRTLGSSDRIHCIQPTDYPTLLYLLSECYLVLTDSGGIQEEAPSFHKPVLIMRKVTERPEVLEVGAGELVGTSTKRVVRETSRLLQDNKLYTTMASARNPFGDGQAAERICRVLV
jgi:UDP-N-acetylglucosamine 2-epimerase (non-hydrolysing)